MSHSLEQTLDQKWLLPQGVLELLPDQAEQLENMRRLCVDLYHSRGYRLVAPPLMEYLEALLTGSDLELDLRTLKITDQLSGRLMGVRADITPQVARMDAHELQTQTNQINRLCYVGSVLHAKPSDLLSPRTFEQTGVEIYGHAGIESDREALEILIETCYLASDSANLTINVGHLGVCYQMCDYFYRQANAPVSKIEKSQFMKAVATKCSASLEALSSAWGFSNPVREALLGWVNLQGGVEILEDLLPRAVAVLKEERLVEGLQQTLQPLAKKYPKVSWFLDCSEPMGYAYHTGLVYAVYADAPVPVASGGRYDGLGEPFGRSRPATGFSADLLALSELRQSALETGSGANIIWAPVEPDPVRSVLLDRKIQQLRAASHPVSQAFSEHEQPADGQPYLTFDQGEWVVSRKVQTSE